MLLACISAVCLAVAPGAPASGGSSPTGAIRALATAYEGRSVGTIDGLLTADYRFHAEDPRTGHLSEFGFARDDEMIATRNMLLGVTTSDGRKVAAAESIWIEAGAMDEGPDPEHPDSTAHYRLVAVHGFVMHAMFPDGMVIPNHPELHVFHLVRGDAGVLTATQSATPQRWYIRRWLESVTSASEALTGVVGDCEQAKGGAVTMPVQRLAGSDPAFALAIHPLGNPACPALDIRCDLPGREPAKIEVFDVTGRRVSHHEIPVAMPGTRTISAGAGASLKPGAYWVRLSQGHRKASTALVLVAK